MKRSLCLAFLIYVRTIWLTYSGQEPKKIIFLIAVYVSDTPVTLKQDQGHKTWYELEDPQQGYNNAKFEKPRWNDVREKATDKVFVKSRNTSVISFECVRKPKIVVYS